MSRTSSVATMGLAVLGLAVAAIGIAPAARAASKVHTAEELFQPFLEGELSQWMIGPVGRLATEEEIDRYLRLKTAEEAESFIDEFWAKRDPDPSRPGNPVLELYESRAAEADKKYSEAAVAGRRTDRGTIHVLYGEPESVEYEEFREVSGPDVELWRYPKNSQVGLDGRKPVKEYRFAKLDDLTRFYSAREMNDSRRRRQTGEPAFPGGPGEPDDPREPGLPGETPP